MIRMKFFVIPKWDIVIGAPPKCGSTSIRVALQAGKVDYEMKYAHQLPKGSTIYFIVRHPLDRFKSLWRFRCVPGGDVVHGTGRDLHGMTPAQFWRYIRKAPLDQHWRPQTELLEGLDATLIPLDGLQAWWKTTPSKLPLLRANATHGDVQLDTPLHNAILEHYDDDLRLYAEISK